MAMARLTKREADWIEQLQDVLEKRPRTLWFAPDPDGVTIHIGKGEPTHHHGSSFTPYGAISSFDANDDDLYVDEITLPGYSSVRHVFR